MNHDVVEEVLDLCDQFRTRVGEMVALPLREAKEISVIFDESGKFYWRLKRILSRVIKINKEKALNEEMKKKIASLENSAPKTPPAKPKNFP
jgi:hypothetical protein